MLLKSINTALDAALTERQVEMAFEPFWAKLKVKLDTLPKPETTVPAKRGLEDMIAEILSDVRAIRSATPAPLAVNYIPMAAYTGVSGLLGRAGEGVTIVGGNFEPTAMMPGIISTNMEFVTDNNPAGEGFIHQGKASSPLLQTASTPETKDRKNIKKS